MKNTVLIKKSLLLFLLLTFLVLRTSAQTNFIFLDSSYGGSCGQSIINNGFEESSSFLNSINSSTIINESYVNGWKTTGSDNNIEIWSNGFS